VTSQVINQIEKGLVNSKMNYFVSTSDLNSISRQGEISTLAIIQGMHPFQVEADANQAPLTRCCDQTAQRELAKPQHLLDNANGWFHRRFTQTIDGLAKLCFQFAGQFFLRSCFCWGRVSLLGKIGLPALMMTLPPGSNVRFNPSALESLNISLTKGNYSG